MRKTIAMEFFIAMALLAGMTTASDTEAPVVDSFSVTPSAVDVSSSSVEVAWEAEVTEVGEVDSCDIIFASPSGSQMIEGYDGNEPGNAEFPSGIEPGTWQVACIQTEDALGNEASYCNTNVDFSLGELEGECDCTAQMDLSSGDVEVTNTVDGDDAAAVDDGDDATDAAAVLSTLSATTLASTVFAVSYLFL